MIKINVFFVRRPWLMFLLTVGLIFVFNASVAFCVSSNGDWAGNKSFPTLPENTGLLEAAIANRVECPSNFNDYTFPMRNDYFPYSIYKEQTGLGQAVIANRSQFSSNQSINALHVINDSNNNNASLSSEDSILAELKTPSPFPFTKETFYANIKSTQLLLEHQHNIIAQNIANTLSNDMLHFQEGNPEKDLKILIQEYLTDHSTKTQWGLTLNQDFNYSQVIAKKIIGYNHFTIHNAKENLSINEKIIRAHINTQIVLQNVSVEKNKSLQDLLSNDALYDSLFQKQFLQR